MAGARLAGHGLAGGVGRPGLARVGDWDCDFEIGTFVGDGPLEDEALLSAPVMDPDLPFCEGVVGTGDGILDMLFLRVDAIGPKSAGSLSFPVTVSFIFNAILTDFSFNWGEKVAPFTSSLALISSQFFKSSLCLSPAAIKRSTTADAFSLYGIK